MDVWQSTCKRFTQHCVVVALPPIADGGDLMRTSYLSVLEALATKVAQRPEIRIVWFEGGEQPHLESAVGFTYGYPALSMVHVNRGISIGYVGTYRASDIGDFVERVVLGQEKMRAITLPRIPKILSTLPGAINDATDDDEPTSDAAAPAESEDTVDKPNAPDNASSSSLPEDVAQESKPKTSSEPSSSAGKKKTGTGSTTSNTAKGGKATGAQSKGKTGTAKAGTRAGKATGAKTGTAKAGTKAGKRKETAEGQGQAASQSASEKKDYAERNGQSDAIGGKPKGSEQATWGERPSGKDGEEASESDQWVKFEDVLEDMSKDYEAQLDDTLGRYDDMLDRWSSDMKKHGIPEMETKGPSAEEIDEYLNNDEPPPKVVIPDFSAEREEYEKILDTIRSADMSRKALMKEAESLRDVLKGRDGATADVLELTEILKTMSTNKDDALRDEYDDDEDDEPYERVAPKGGKKETEKEKWDRLKMNMKDDPDAFKKLGLDQSLEELQGLQSQFASVKDTIPAMKDLLKQMEGTLSKLQAERGAKAGDDDDEDIDADD
eukprot:Opistho-2@88277